MALAADVSAPNFAQLIGPIDHRVRQPLVRTLGWLQLLLGVLAVQAALALAFDPRYRDFPFAPLTCAVVPVLLLAFLVRKPEGGRAMAESVTAAVLILAAVAIAIQEGVSNWQALWCCAALAGLALTLVRARSAPG